MSGNPEKLQFPGEDSGIIEEKILRKQERDDVHIKELILDIVLKLSPEKQALIDNGIISPDQITALGEALYDERMTPSKIRMIGGSLLDTEILKIGIEALLDMTMVELNKGIKPYNQIF